jgi:ABC-type multidrug transport system, ATPase and permease components
VLQVMLLNNTILPNFGTLVRWRAHRHVLRQSVGWFEDDFAGRIANRIMQTPPAAGEVVFQLFDAITFAIAYIIGAIILLGDADMRLILPLLVWLIPYLFLLAWVVRRIGPASEASSNARSVVTGRVVDSYTNIHSVKMFAHHDSEIAYAKDAIENARRTFQHEMRLYTLMDVVLMVLNGVLIVGVVGWAIGCGGGGTATLGVVAVATSLTLRLNAMSGWIMWAISNFFRELGVVAEGMQTIAQPVTLLDRTCNELQVTGGVVTISDLSHHYGRAKGGAGPDQSADSHRVKRSGLWASLARANRPWSSCCCGSTTSNRAASPSTGRTSRMSRKTACAAPSGWCSRIRHYCIGRCGKTSCTATPTPPRTR